MNPMPRFPIKRREKASEKIYRFHAREFYLNNLQVLLQSFFQKLNMFGVFSSAKRENLRNKVERIKTQIDKLRFRSIINLSHRNKGSFIYLPFSNEH